MRLQPQPFFALFLLFSSLLFPYSAPARVIYVAPGATGDGSGSSWGNAFTNIRAGWAASASGDEIWVKSATYSWIEMYRKSNIALYGGHGEAPRGHDVFADRAGHEPPDAAVVLQERGHRKGCSLRATLPAQIHVAADENQAGAHDPHGERVSPQLARIDAGLSHKRAVAHEDGVAGDRPVI